MNIIFEDKHLIVCRKERGILSQDSDGRDTMPERLREHTKGEIFVVHRLDKEVGGLMVFAKTQKAAASLSKQVTDRTMKKEYLALVHGEPHEGAMEDLLFFDKAKNKSFVVKKERRGVKKALLDYKTLERRNGESLVRVRLHTGRTHQIRVQFASRKMPLYGDRRYGARDESKAIALWSCSLSFAHPVTGEEMSFELLPYGDEAFEDYFVG